MTTVLAADNKSVSLTARKNIRDHDAERVKYLKEIEQATGVSGWTFDFQGDLAAFNDAVSSGYKDRMGEIFFGSYLQKIAELIGKEMKDDMVKEAFVEATSAKKIVFTPLADKDASGGYQRIQIKDGVFTIGCHPDNYWANIGDVAYVTLEKYL